MAITKEEIFAAAEKLDELGQKPTLAAVRKALGGGSYSTISEAMSQWRARKEKEETTLREPLPQEISQHLADFGAEIWLRALEFANGRLAAERQALDVASAQLHSETREAAELADQMTAELETQQQKVAALETAHRNALDAGGVLRSQLASAEQRAATAEARLMEIEKRVADLNAELGRVNSQNAELVRALAGTAKAPIRK